MIIEPSNAARRAALPSLAVAAAVAMLLSGCSYRMDRVENPVALPAKWDAPNSANAQPGIPKEWWKAFNSPVLNGLIEESFKSNPSIIATDERVKQAERTLDQARDTLIPDLSVSASTSRGRSGGNNGRVETSTESTSVTLSSSYSVDLWGATAARYRASIATFINTKWDAEYSRITLAGQVARAYFSLLSAKSNLAVQQDNLAKAEELLGIVEARAREGLVNEFDLLQQRTQVQQNRTNIIQPEIAVRQAETALGLLVGRTPQEFHIEPEPIAQLTVPEVAPWLPGELLLRRPDIASSETDLVNAKVNVYVARTSLIPVTMTLSANGSSSSQELLTLTDTRNFSLQGALSVATGILNYKQRRISYLNAKSNEYIALVNYANTIRTALKEVDDNLANAEAAQRSEISQQLTLDTAQRSLDLVTIQLREGTASQEQLLNAQRTLFQAQESLARQRVSRLTSAVTLYTSLGGGWEGPSPAELEMMQPKKK